MDRISPDEFAERVGREVTRTLSKLKGLDEDRVPAEVLARRIVARYVAELEDGSGGSVSSSRRRGHDELSS